MCEEGSTVLRRTEVTYVCGVLIAYRNVGYPGNVYDTDEMKAIYFNCIRLTV